MLTFFLLLNSMREQLRAFLCDNVRIMYTTVPYLIVPIVKIIAAANIVQLMTRVD